MNKTRYARVVPAGHHRRLLQLRDEVATVRAALEDVSAPSNALETTVATRPLTERERAEAVRLGKEQTRLRWRMRALQLELEVLRDERAAASQ